MNSDSDVDIATDEARPKHAPMRVEEAETRTEQAMRRGMVEFFEKPLLREHFLTSLSPRAEDGQTEYEARPIAD